MSGNSFGLSTTQPFQGVTLFHCGAAGLNLDDVNFQLCFETRLWASWRFSPVWILPRLWNSIFFWVWQNWWFSIVILILGANLPELSFDEKQISLEAAPLSAKWVLEGFVFLLQNFSRHIIQQMEEKKLTTHSHVGKRKLERITFRPILKKLWMKFCVSIEFSLLKIWNWRKRNCRRRLKYSEPCHIRRDSF